MSAFSASRSGRALAFAPPQGPNVAQFAELATSLGCRVRDDPLTRAATAPDASHVLLTPAVVVAPPDAAVVAQLLPSLAAHGLHLTFRSGGTSLCGQAVTDSVLLDVRRGFRGIEVLDDGACVRVEGGATLRAVNQRLAMYGRRLGPDPASEAACTIGGVVANNSSGMACGIEQNSYRTLHSMELVLADGLRLDTGASDVDERLRSLAPELYVGLLRLRDRVRGDSGSVERLRLQFAIKNTMGYGLNSFLDHDSPAQILAHLMVGSEGTLGFVASATFDTVPLLAHKATALVLLKSLAHAAEAVPQLVAGQVTLAELMDSSSLATARASSPGLAHVQDSRPGHAALLVECQTDDPDEAIGLPEALHTLLRSLEGVQHVAPATGVTDRAALWAMRKGLYAAVAAARPPGTTALLEDVCVPVDKLAGASAALSCLLAEHGYEGSVIFGHAKDGNLHFMINDRFEDDRLSAYAAFTEALVDLVLAHDGSLKAEHGTGRVMAPFVRRQFGDELYAVMCEVKQLLDPHGVLNPGVVVGAPDDAHLRDLKTTPLADPETDACVECGYCEPVCPSKDLTLTPRQRIALRRAEATLVLEGGVQPKDRRRALELLHTCAADGMCQTACPVGIDTGSMVKRIRADTASPGVRKAGVVAAKNWDGLTTTAASALNTAARVPRIAETTTRLLRAATASAVPSWTPDLPRGGRSRSHLVTDHQTGPVYLLPSCLETIFASDPGSARAFLDLCERAGIEVTVPPDVVGLCCGTPWRSKGLHEGAVEMEERTRAALSGWSEGRAITVVVDASSCSAPVALLAAAARPAHVAVVDVVQFAAEELLPRLVVRRRLERVVVHPTCGTVKNGLSEALLSLVGACAEHVIVADAWGCCAFAGDRGLLQPDLTASATQAEAAELMTVAGDYYVSDNRGCQVAMGRAVARDFRHVVELLEQVTR